MYELLAISTGDLAAWIAALAGVGVLLGMCLGWLLHYVLGNERRITAVEGAIKALHQRLDDFFLDDKPQSGPN